MSDLKCPHGPEREVIFCSLCTEEKLRRRDEIIVNLQKRAFTNFRGVGDE